MPSPKRVSPREPLKQNHIVDSLREKIVMGTLRPGNRLPLRSEIERRFGASVATVQAAMNRLIEDGFIRAQGRSGTFVADFPPHLCHYGLAFLQPPTSPQVRSRFWLALSNTARNLDREKQRKSEIYVGVDSHSDTEVNQKLLRDMREQRLAGVIIACTGDAEALELSPILDSPATPIVVIDNDPTKSHGMNLICLDMRSMIDRALDAFAARGRRRVALLTMTGMTPGHLEHFHVGLAKRALTTRPYWTQCVGWPEVNWASNAVHAMMHAEQKTRPDALLIFDDNLVEHAAAGLLAAGIRVPDQLDVIAHGNLPWPAPSALPFRNLGFDARSALRLAIENIDLQRAGKAAPKLSLVSAVFEDQASHAKAV